jgi:type 1 fimbria pilin
MKNIRRLALVAGVATLSAVAFSPKAQAQTTNVDFTGSIPATCTINSTTNGTLALKSPSALVAWGGKPSRRHTRKYQC